MTIAMPVGSGSMDANPSLWNALSPSPPSSPALRGRHHADVVVIGAGISGLSTALHLARAGRSVIVLEAARRPDAATGASGGIVAPQLVRTTPNKVLRRLGQGAGNALLRGVAESGRYLFDLIDEEGMACEAMSKGFVAPFFGGPARHARTIDEWKPWRTDLRLLDAAEIEALSGCRGYTGAILDPSGGGLNPVAYADALAERVSAHGGQIFRDSPVSRVERSDKAWSALTADGVAVGAQLVLCANGGNAALHPKLANSILPLPVCEVATMPLPPALREAILPHGHALTDLSSDIFTIRFDIHGRLITACPAPERLDPREIEIAINRRLAHMLPAWRETPLEFVWRGTAWLNSDLLPRIAPIEEGLTAVQACNGRGIAMNSLAGREVAKWIVSGQTDTPMVPLIRPRAVAGFALTRHIPRLIMAGARLSRSLTGRS